MAKNIKALILIIITYLFFYSHAESMVLNTSQIVSAINPTKLPINAWLVNQISQDLELSGLKSSIEGITIPYNHDDRDDSCETKRFNSSLSLRLSFYNSSHILPNLTQDSSINYFTANSILDSTGYQDFVFEMHPSSKVTFLGCVEAATPQRKETHNAQGFSALSTFNLNLNPKYVPQGLSASGNPEISFSPTGSLGVNIKNYDVGLRSNFDNGYIKINNPATQAISIFGTLNTLNQAYLVYSGVSMATASGTCLAGSPAYCIAVSAINAIIGIYNTIQDKYKVSVENIQNNILGPQANTFFSQFTGSGYQIDISSQLGAYTSNNIILPSNSDIVSIILPKLLQVNNVCPIVGHDALADPGKALYDFMLNDTARIQNHLKQATEACTPVAIGVATPSPAYTGTLVTLDGSGSSDASGTALTYAWTQTSGPTVSFNGVNTAKASFKAATPGDYGFTLAVTNGYGLSTTQAVSVPVKFNPGVLAAINMLLEDCTVAVSPPLRTIANLGGKSTASVTAPPDCSWTASSNTSWLTITSGAKGRGNGIIRYQVAANPVYAARSGSITVAGENSQSVTVSQRAKPGISVGNANLKEGAAGTLSLANFRVTLNTASSTPVTVNYATRDGTASAGSDYVAKSGTLTFAKAQTSAILSIQVIGDGIKEKNETFILELSNPQVPYGLSVPVGTGTIRNDD